MRQRYWILTLIILTALSATMMARDDCRKPGTASFKLDKMFHLEGCKPHGAN